VFVTTKFRIDLWDVGIRLVWANFGSSVLAELARQGYPAVDTDVDGWIEVVEGGPLWEPLIEELQTPGRTPVLQPWHGSPTLYAQARHQNRNAQTLLSRDDLDSCARQRLWEVKR
jgi:hypothetical protein